jgi:hypothetical protein
MIDFKSPTVIYLGSLLLLATGIVVVTGQAGAGLIVIGIGGLLLALILGIIRL